ncbi:hypothetical protein PRIPAC_97706, partial [Pristionchus pacificus]
LPKIGKPRNGLPYQSVRLTFRAHKQDIVFSISEGANRLTRDQSERRSHTLQDHDIAGTVVAPCAFLAEERNSSKFGFSFSRCSEGPNYGALPRGPPQIGRWHCIVVTAESDADIDDRNIHLG